jgi:hypothetical protein
MLFMFIHTWFVVTKAFFVIIEVLFDPAHGAFHVVACSGVWFTVRLALLSVTQFVVVLVASVESN